MDLFEIAYQAAQAPAWFGWSLLLGGLYAGGVATGMWFRHG